MLSLWNCQSLKDHIKYPILLEDKSSHLPFSWVQSLTLVYLFLPPPQVLMPITLVCNRSRQSLTPKAINTRNAWKARAGSCSSLYPQGTYSKSHSKHSISVCRMELLFKSSAKDFQPNSTWPAFILSRPDDIVGNILAATLGSLTTSVINSQNQLRVLWCDSQVHHIIRPHHLHIWIPRTPGHFTTDKF